VASATDLAGAGGVGGDGGGATGRVEFQYHGFRVTVSSDGWVTVEEEQDVGSGVG